MNLAVFELAPCFLRACRTKKDKGTKRDKSVIKLQTGRWTKLYEQWIFKGIVQVLVTSFACKLFKEEMTCIFI